MGGDAAMSGLCGAWRIRQAVLTPDELFVGTGIDLWGCRVNHCGIDLVYYSSQIILMGAEHLTRLGRPSGKERYPNQEVMSALTPTSDVSRCDRQSRARAVRAMA
jgi:RES domain-containing protein